MESGRAEQSSSCSLDTSERDGSGWRISLFAKMTQAGNDHRSEQIVSRRTDANSKMTTLMSSSPGRSNQPPGTATRRGSHGGTPVGAVDMAVVLVLDDDISIRRSLRRLISAAGFQVQTFSKPSELLASEIPGSNACMVVDIDLPEMTGIEMCKILKGLGRSLPTILITGRTDAHTRFLAAQADPVALLFKPFQEEPLLDAIGRALALSTQGQPDK